MLVAKWHYTLIVMQARNDDDDDDDDDNSFIHSFVLLYVDVRCGIQ